MSIVRRLIDAAKGKHPLSAKRSGSWPRVRAEHLAKFPACAVCGSTEKVEVHHIKPFHKEPQLELSPSNLETLCESNPVFNCHRIFGHLNNFKGWNPDVKADAAAWRAKLSENRERVCPLATTKEGESA